MSSIKADHISMRFQTRHGEVEALRDVSVDIESNDFTCIVGGSGCGKSTLLNIMAGLLYPTDGTILVDDQAVEGPDRDRGMVFQSYTLYEWQTVRENVEFGLKLAGRSKDERRDTAARLLSSFGLEGFEDQYPTSLSGGMQQRVAIARALANEPKVLLMDEPFGALDALTRSSMQTFLTDLWQRDRRTIVFVTHDIEEALLLGRSVIVMSPRPGRVKQILKVELPDVKGLELTTTPEFMEQKRQILDLILEAGEGGADDR